MNFAAHYRTDDEVTFQTGRSPDEVLSILAAEFDAPQEQIRREVAEFVEQFATSEDDRSRGRPRVSVPFGAHRLGPRRCQRLQ